MTDEYEDAGPEAWDRFGNFLGIAGGMGQAMSRRNLNLWREVSANLRKGEQYTADDMAADWARLTATTMDNLQDMWDLWTTIPDRQTVARSLPTAFLYYARAPSSTGGDYAVPDPVWIPVAPSGEELPQNGSVGLSGGRDRDAAQRLEASISAVRGKHGRGYSLVPVSAGEIEPGAYSGLVYIRLGRREVPIADLRVVVED